MRALSVDLDAPASRPYFVWDEDLTVAELHAALRAEERDLIDLLFIERQGLRIEDPAVTR